MTRSAAGYAFIAGWHSAMKQAKQQPFKFNRECIEQAQEYEKSLPKRKRRYFKKPRA